MSAVSGGAVSTDKPFGVFTGTRSYWDKGTDTRAVLRIADGTTHHIRIVDKSAKWFRYVLLHDQKEYLIVLPSMVEVLDMNTPVNCLTCLSKGTETPEET